MMGPLLVVGHLVKGQAGSSTAAKYDSSTWSSSCCISATTCGWLALVYSPDQGQPSSSVLSHTSFISRISCTTSKRSVWLAGKYAWGTGLESMLPATAARVQWVGSTYEGRATLSTYLQCTQRRCGTL